MTDKNAKDWIADMETDWIYSDPVCIAVAECVSDDSVHIYTSFDGTKDTPAVGNQGTDVDMDVVGDWFQHSFSKAAYNRGLQLIDYEASKLLANLFVAKYGRRNSQNQLGGGRYSNRRPLGSTRKYGMADTVVPKNATSFSDSVYQNASIAIITDDIESWINVTSNSFLGIENISGNCSECLDRCYTINDTKENCNKLRVTHPNLETRRIYVVGGEKYIKSVRYGKYCDIVCCSSGQGTSVNGYSDKTNCITDSSLHINWGTVRAVSRSDSRSAGSGGVFFLANVSSVRYSAASNASRLLFRGNMIETADIDKFLNEKEWRG